MDYRTVLTICPYCGCGCGMYLEVLDGEVIGILPSVSHPISQGALCIKGWNAHEFISSDKRLKKPLMKKNGSLSEVSWEEAIGYTAKELKGIRDRYGPDSIGVLTSAKCTNEENYLLMKLTRAILGTNNIDHCARLWHSSTVAGLAKAFGSGAMTNSVPDLEEADCFLVTGSNTTETHPLIASRVFKAKEKGAKLIVIEPREIHLASYADLYLRQRPGTDVAWINGMMNIIISQGWQDDDFIKNRTEGFEALREKVKEYPSEKVEQITGIPRDDLFRAAEMYAKSEKSAILYAMGITQHISGTDNVLSLCNLAMLTGSIGKRGSGVNPLRGQNNVQGACDLGGLPNVFTAYQAVTDDNARKKFEEAWGSKLPAQVGLTLMEMMDGAAEGKIKAMFILGENPLLSDPDISHVKEALPHLEFLAVQDIFLTETAQLANVVLAGASWAEKDGTFTGTDRRVQRIRKAIEPIGESKPDWQILCQLSKEMGGKGFDYQSPEEVFEEIARLTPSYQGISYSRLDKEGLQWPCRSSDDPGTEFLHNDKFSKGLGTFNPVDFREPAELPDEQYPLILTTGRGMFQYHTGTLTRNSPTLESEFGEGFVEINPLDAEELNIADDEMVKVASRRGEVRIKAQLTPRVDKGVVFIPFHFAESAANVLTNSALDPVAKIPELKVCAVKVEKI